MTIDDKIEQACSAWEGIEGARWRMMEWFADILDSASSQKERKFIMDKIADRTGRGAAVVRLWAKAVHVVPPDLRHPYLPIYTCLWAAQNLAPEEAQEWLKRCHDEGMSLRQLQQALGIAQDAATVVSLRRILRSIAKDMPDEPMNPELAGVLEAMLLAALQPYINETKPPATEVTEG